jgi:hypothetical protein
MKVRFNELEVVESEPFANCKLERERYAKVLTKIVESYADGFVLAINNKWGTGKTTFVKMWKCDLHNKGFKTFYFNAWENDFDTEPLPALIAELRDVIGTDKTTFNNLLSNAASVSKIILPSIAKHITSKYIGDEASDIIFDSTEAATEVIKDEVDHYLKKKNGIKAFKEDLYKLVKNVDSKKPFVFIIDELDRCRPDYAVEILEKVKHFFSIPGIVFVLSIDKKQLGYAIQGYYGSAMIDTDEYLRRFIDLEYSIPEPSYEAYSNYLFDILNFKEFFSLSISTGNDAYHSDIKNITIFFGKNFNYTLRQLEKLYTHTRIVIRAFSSLHNIKLAVIVFLIHLKLFQSELYDKLKRAELSMQEFIDQIESLFIFNSEDQFYHSLVYIIADLSLLYNYYYNEINCKYNGRNNMLLKRNENEKDEYEFFITSKTDQYYPNTSITSLREAIIYCFKEDYKYIETNLGFYLNKVDILENLKSE